MAATLIELVEVFHAHGTDVLAHLVLGVALAGACEVELHPQLVLPALALEPAAHGGLDGDGVVGGALLGRQVGLGEHPDVEHTSLDVTGGAGGREEGQEGVGVGICRSKSRRRRRQRRHRKGRKGEEWGEEGGEGGVREAGEEEGMRGRTEGK